MRKKYEADLTDEQWEVIAPLFVHMRKYKWEKRELVKKRESAEKVCKYPCNVVERKNFCKKEKPRS